MEPWSTVDWDRPFKSLDEIEMMSNEERRDYIAELLVTPDPTVVTEMLAARDAAYGDSTAA